MEEAVAQLLGDMEDATEQAETLRLGFKPKAIYVCNTNVVADTPNQTDNHKQPFGQRQAPPILIWRYLVEQMGVDPSTVAVYSNLKVDKDHPLPDEFVLFSGGDKDFDNFSAGDYQHIIFNLTLQEGWDDPAVYFAYIDKSMGSDVQVTQVVGRVLRQPDSRHYRSDRLNTAHFYVRVDKQGVFDDVIMDVRNQLGSAGGGIEIVVTSPGKTKPEEWQPSTKALVPETAAKSELAAAPIAELFKNFPDFDGDTKNTKGTGSRRVLRQKVGEDGTPAGPDAWEEYEQSAQASARWLFHREVQRRMKSALGVVDLSHDKLNAIVGIGSPAQAVVLRLAGDVVDAYISGVRLTQRGPLPYEVGAIMVRPDEAEKFDNSVHAGYSGMNNPELEFARVIDKTGLTWARNPSQSGYKIPLVSVGPTSYFYPDFLIWTDERVICLDTKGQHLIQETAARKMLRINSDGKKPRLDVQFVSTGRYDVNLSQTSKDGHTAWGLSDDGSVAVVHYESLDALVAYVVDDRLHN